MVASASTIALGSGDDDGEGLGDGEGDGDVVGLELGLGDEATGVPFPHEASAIIATIGTPILRVVRIIALPIGWYPLGWVEPWQS